LYFDVEAEFFLYLAHGPLLDALVGYLRIVAYFALGERPVAEDVVHERKVHLAAVARVDDRAAEALNGHLVVRDVLLALTDLVLARLAELLVHGAENPVDEAAALLAPVALGEL